MKNLMRCGVILAAAFVFGACGSSDRTEDIKAEAPAGTFANQPWTMKHATVTRDGTELSIRLFSEQVEDCAVFPPSGSSAGYIMWTMPAQVGKRELQLSLTDLGSDENQTITFVTPPSSNNIAVDGAINLTELTETSVTLGFIAEAGEGYEVTGTFTAKLCE